MNIEVYTDGSATVVSKPGGWAYVIVVDGKKYAECAGHMPLASNNDAEMQAAIEGLESVLQMFIKMGDFATLDDFTVTLVSDSQLVLGWVSGKFRFKQESKMDKFNQLSRLVRKLRVKTRWVQGHTGDVNNERCDQLANEARLSNNTDARVNPRYKNIEIGQKFGKLEVLSLMSDKQGAHAIWLCKCDCGNTADSRSDALVTGKAKSCGCAKVKLADGELSLNYSYSVYQRNAARRKIRFDLTRPDFENIATNNCYYCGEEPQPYNPFIGRSGKQYRYNVSKELVGRSTVSINGIDRKDPAVGYSIENCVPSCKTCNFAKGMMDEKEFDLWIRKVYTHINKDI